MPGKDCSSRRLGGLIQIYTTKGHNIVGAGRTDRVRVARSPIERNGKAELERDSSTDGASHGPRKNQKEKSTESRDFRFSQSFSTAMGIVPTIMYSHRTSQLPLSTTKAAQLPHQAKLDSKHPAAIVSSDVSCLIPILPLPHQTGNKKRKANLISRSPWSS